MERQYDKYYPHELFSGAGSFHECGQGYGNRGFVYEFDDINPDYPPELIRDVYDRMLSGYDIVAANILADVLVPLTPVIVSQLKAGGIYITSGIIDDKRRDLWWRQSGRQGLRCWRLLIRASGSRLPPKSLRSRKGRT